MSLLNLFTRDVRESPQGKEKGGAPESDRQGGDVMNIRQKAENFNREMTVDDAKLWISQGIRSAHNLGSLRTTVETITPLIATAILEVCNINNRALRKDRVAVYAAAMREGRWKLTSQGVSIARDGTLNNGQHRLQAVISSGASVEMSVTFGEDRDVFDILDTGAVRSASDTLNIAGFKATSNLAASARVLLMIEEEVAASNKSYTNDVIKNWVERHPDLQEYTGAGSTIGKKLRTSQAGCTAAFYLIGTQSKYRDYLKTFTGLLSEGAGLSKRGPILTLREGLLRDDFFAKAHPGIKGPIVTATIINAWNLWLLDRKGSVPALTWQIGTPFPKAK